MGKPETKTSHKKLRKVDSIRPSKAGLSTATTGEVITYETRLAKVSGGVARAVPKVRVFVSAGLGTARRQAVRQVSNLRTQMPSINMPQVRVSHRVKSVVASTSLALMMVLMFFNLGIGNIARAFEDLNQSDWSGGVGASPVDQYSAGDNVVTTTPNRIELGVNQQNQWCNTALCDNQWQYRKSVWLPQYSVDLTGRSSVQLEFDLEYTAAMKSDFSDVRFVSANDSQDIPYVITSKTNGGSAHFIVKVPVVNGDSPEMLRVYYGNANASSVENKASTLDIWDEFDQGRSCPAGNPIGCTPNTAVVNMGELEINSDSYYPSNDYVLPRGIDRIFQIDIKPRDAFGCDYNNYVSYMSLGNGNWSQDPSGTVSMYTYGRGGGQGCYDAKSQHQLAYLQSYWLRDGQNYGGGGWLENDQILKHAAEDTEWLTIRTVMKAAGGV